MDGNVDDSVSVLDQSAPTQLYSNGVCGKVYLRLEFCYMKSYICKQSLNITNTTMLSLETARTMLFGGDWTISFWVYVPSGSIETQILSKSATRYTKTHKIYPVSSILI